MEKKKWNGLKSTRRGRKKKAGEREAERVLYKRKG